MSANARDGEKVGDIEEEENNERETGVRGGGGKRKKRKKEKNENRINVVWKREITFAKEIQL